MPPETRLVVTADTTQAQTSLDRLLAVITEIKEAWDELPPELREAMSTPSLVVEQSVVDQ